VEEKKDQKLAKKTETAPKTEKKKDKK